MTSKRTALGAGVAVAALIGCGAASAQTLGEAVAAGKPILEVRARYESVDQANLAPTAEAFTVRTRFGWETAAWHGLRGLVEFEGVHGLGGEDYNTTINGRTAYPVIADPDVNELNRLQVSWAPSKAFAATLGRQRINFDDQRFVGAVGWRQDEQTLDAVRADLRRGKAAVTVVYVDHVNRLFAETLDWESRSWLVNAAYAGPAAFQPSAFLYALDFATAPASSSLTAGVRVVGVAKAGKAAIAYSASLARQTEHGNNPADFSLDYRQAEVAGTVGVATLRATYESLEGDGARGFATPLATLHAFQGWADVFLTTPANGVDDVGATLVLKPPVRLARLSGVQLTARFHDFTAARGGADLGEELDLMAQAVFTPRLSGYLKYADYDGAPGFPSRTKVWLGFDFKL